MKKSILLIMAFTLLFSGCKNDNVIVEEQATETKDQSKFEIDLSTLPTTYYSIQRAEDFSDGYAWAKFEIFNTGEEKWGCIDKEGNVQFFLSDEYEYQNKSGNYMSHSWVDDTCLVEVTGVDKGRIFDLSGNVIFETDETYIDVLFYMDGYYAVAKHVGGFDKDEYSVCFISTKGEWSDKEWALDGKDILSVGYLGEGILCYGEEFYNFNTGKTFKGSNTDLYFELRSNFSNGVCLYENINGQYGLLYSDGRMKEIEIDLSNVMYSNIEGDYVVLDNQSEIYLYNVQTNKLEKVCTLSNDTYIENYGDLHYIDDKIFTKILGVDRNHYFTFYDKYGKMLFEPIQAEEIGNVSCDRIITKSSDIYTVYNTAGGVVFTGNQYNTIDQYSDGVAIVGRKNYDPYYIDTEGNKLFNTITYNGETYEPMV